MANVYSNVEIKVKGFLRTALSAEASTATIDVDFVKEDDPTTTVSLQSDTLMYEIDPLGKTGKVSEICLAASNAADTPVTGRTRFSTNTRGISKEGHEQTGSASRANSWDVGTEVAIATGTMAKMVNLLAQEVSAIAEGDGASIQLPVYATATTRDAAIPSPSNGELVYQTDVATNMQYIGGAWSAVATGAVVAAADHTAGKVDIASATEIGAGTATDATSGATNVIPVSQTVKTSSGAGDENKLIVLNSAGKPADGFLHFADEQVFTVDGTWTKPTSFTPKFVKIIMYGAGGSGGGGMGGNVGTVRRGGTGGGGGCKVERTFDATDLGATETVVVGVGAAGGAGGSAGEGTSGTAGEASQFGSFFFAYGGGAGYKGTATAAGTAGSGGGGGGGASAGGTGAEGAASAGGYPGVTTSILCVGTQGMAGSITNTTAGAEFGGAGGGCIDASNPAFQAYKGWKSLYGGGGGGAGGGVLAANTETVGGGGGGVLAYPFQNTVVGGGAVNGGAGAAGADGNSTKGGAGGAGGGGQDSGTGGVGGDGGVCGGGGGGGGGGTTVGGAGGKGGDGKVWVYSW